MAFTEFGDVIELRDGDALKVEFSGAFGAELNPSDNSVLHAVRWLEKRHAITIKKQIHIEKNIPVMAGLGGGTADCAAVIRALCKLYELKMPEPRQLAALGADVPVSFYGQTARMEGIGEVIYPATLDREYDIVLVNPGKPVSTRTVFERLTSYSAPIASQSSYSLADIAAQANDLQMPAIEICPEIREILTVIEELSPKLARMSGSGATVFALFETGTASMMAKRVRARFPDYWVQATQIRRATT